MPLKFNITTASILSLVLLLPTTSLALTIDFIGPCDSTPFLSKEIPFTPGRTVGEVSIETLEQAQIAYQGSVRGLNQILNSPLGLDALEVVSDTEMLAYGWCFSVDGAVPEAYADEISLNGVNHLRWFYAFAHYLNGQWVAQCSVSYQRRSPFICRN